MNFDVIVVSGPAGAGKTTLGIELASQLGWLFKDGDDFHSEANKAKMKTGTPLTDDDRYPWLAKFVDFWRTNGSNVVFACSALKKVYRDRLRSGMRCRFLLLEVDRTLLEERLGFRCNHFMPLSLLANQLSTLEKPLDEPDMITLSVRNKNVTPQQIAQKARELLNI